MEPQPLHRRAAAAAAFTTTPPPTTPHITRGSTPPLPCTPPPPPPYTPLLPCIPQVPPPVSTPRRRRVWRPTPTLRAASTTSPSRTACRTSQQVIPPEKSLMKFFIAVFGVSGPELFGSGSSIMDPDPNSLKKLLKKTSAYEVK